MIRITPDRSHALYSVAATRLLEQAAQASLAPHTLMQRAGLATARLALALAPHAQHVWVACGPGNNGGDGFEAALQLHRLGKRVSVSWTGAANPEPRMPDDAARSLARLRQAGVEPRLQVPGNFNLCIDALLGLGGDLSADRPGSALMREWLHQMQASGRPILSVDLPTGLNADSGHFAGPVFPPSAPRHTLSLLTLKPGLFTAAGRDQAGQVWFDDLGIMPPTDLLASARTNTDEETNCSRSKAAHASHKGSFGDVAVIGGLQATSSGTHMMGAALLAARAALHGGAGRVWVALLGEADLKLDPMQPELMFRHPDALDLEQITAVCGCGGGTAVRSVLPRFLATSARAVLDADALNAIAQDGDLQTLLRARHGQGQATVLTPHPLEAARLLVSSTAEVQADRLQAAQTLADRFDCVVVLKGSGSIIASPHQIPFINLTGNALLATAGTGDVLAGLVGAELAAGQDAWAAARRAVFRHGAWADQWAISRPGVNLTASRLAQGLQRPSQASANQAARAGSA